MSAAHATAAHVDIADALAVREVSTHCLCFAHAMALVPSEHSVSPAVLPPSALTPVPRWRSLPKWSGLYPHPSRIRGTNLAYIRCGDQEDEGSNFVFRAPRKNLKAVVRKVRAGQDAVIDVGSMRVESTCARWVLA